jgi:hypothetical protein
MDNGCGLFAAKERFCFNFTVPSVPYMHEFVQVASYPCQGFLVYPYSRKSLPHSSCKASKGWAQKWRI